MKFPLMLVALLAAPAWAADAHGAEDTPPRSEAVGMLAAIPRGPQLGDPRRALPPRGPFGSRPGESKQALAMSLLEATPVLGADGDDKRPELMSDAEAWAKMPRAGAGGGGPLPNWAKAVATHLPRTAAAMLVLDHAQRTKGALDPALRAKVRLAVAEANRCDYARQTALADLKRANPGGPLSPSPAAEELALEFAKRLTLDAPAVTDAQFAALLAKFGEWGSAAIVYHVAYANFQDRLLLGLGVPLEAGGPMRPLDVTFAAGAFQSAPPTPKRHGLPKLLAGGTPAVPADPEWSKLSYAELQARLEAQRDRKPRLPVPTWERVRSKLPPDLTAKPTRVLWSLFGYEYAWGVAVPWAVCTRTMLAESRQDRVFEASLFWVQTRAARCNYGMGHCEMLLEVAGLDKDAVAERTRRLAGDDWSCFPPAEQRAFAYARKLTARPWVLTAADYRGLEKDLGPDKALFTIWWLCRGASVTRVSDAFQLPLERDNVYGDPPAKK